MPVVPPVLFGLRPHGSQLITKVGVDVSGEILFWVQELRDGLIRKFPGDSDLVGFLSWHGTIMPSIDAVVNPPAPTFPT